MNRICQNCGTDISGLNYRLKYCGENCRTAFTQRRSKEYRERPENKLKAAKRHATHYIKKKRKNHSGRRNKRTDRQIFDETAHLSKGIFTGSKFQGLSPEQIIKAMSKPMRIT